MRADCSSAFPCMGVMRPPVHVRTFLGCCWTPKLPYRCHILLCCRLPLRVWVEQLLLGKSCQYGTCVDAQSLKHSSHGHVMGAMKAAAHMMSQIVPVSMQMHALYNAWMLTEHVQ